MKKVLLYCIGAAIVLRSYIGVSPKMLLLLLLFLFLCLLLRGSSDASEAFSPIYHTETAAGLKWGVASVQGRRPHMEDMYQAAGFDHSAGPNAAGASRLGLTHFFAVYDGHGGKRAAAWAHEHLLANLLETKPDEADVAAVLSEVTAPAPAPAARPKGAAGPLRTACLPPPAAS